MKSKKSQSNEKGPSKAWIIDNIARHIISKRVYPVADSMFPEDFVVYSPEPGESIIYRKVNEDNVVQRVKQQFVVDTVIKWCAENWGCYPELLLEPSVAKEVVKSWLGRVEKIPGTVKGFEFANGESFVSHRVPFSPDLKADFSHIDIKSKEWQRAHPFIEFLSRCSSPNQVAAFIGSIFYEESYMQQYLVIWGDGGDGKGAVTRAIHKILQSSFHVDSFDNMGRFWTSAFVGKRVVLFPDNNDQRAMQTGLWKQLTGGDPVRVEFKNESTFTTQLSAKFILTSNFAPVLKWDAADQRRAIVSRIENASGPIDPNVERRMHETDQLQFLVEYCCWKYRVMCPNHEPIKVDEDQQDHIQNADEEIEQRLLEKFSFGSNTQVISVTDLKNAYGQDYNSNKVARILTSRFKCVSFRARDNNEKDTCGKPVRSIYYVGISLGVSEYNSTRRNSQNFLAVSKLKKYLEAVEKYNALNS
jgi:hypothetical protein